VWRVTLGLNHLYDRLETSVIYFSGYKLLPLCIFIYIVFGFNIDTVMCLAFVKILNFKFVSRVTLNPFVHRLNFMDALFRM